MGNLEKKEPRKKALVVDDTAITRNVIRDMLSLHNMIVDCVDGGEEAISYLEKERVLPDVILMDVMMPRMDGFTATKLIRENEETKNIPIIMCTAKSGSEDIVKASQLGVNGYIVKPFKAEMLRKKVDKALGKQEVCI